MGHGRLSPQWTYDAKSQLVSGATVAAINGQQLLFAGTKDGRIICLDDAGRERWSYSTGERLSDVESYFVDESRVHSIDAAPVVADINQDGVPEVLAGSELGIAYCLSADGKLLWRHDCGGSIRAAMTVADVNMDGHPEVLICSMNKRLTVLAGSGAKLFEFDAAAPLTGVPCVLKGKQPLIIFGDEQGTLTAITPGQEVAWTAQLRHRITAAPIALAHPEEQRVVIGTTGGTMFCISEHGETVWEYHTEGSIYSAACLADINEDRVQEIIFSSCDNAIHALTAQGQRYWSYETDFWATATPVVADINQDGRPEVIAGSYDQSIYVLDGQGTYVLDYMPGLSSLVNQSGHYATLLTSDPGEQTGKQLFRYRLGGLVIGCALLGGRVIAVTSNGSITMLRHER